MTRDLARRTEHLEADPQHITESRAYWLAVFGLLSCHVLRVIHAAMRAAKETGSGQLWSEYIAPDQREMCSHAIEAARLQLTRRRDRTSAKRAGMRTAAHTVRAPVLTAREAFSRLGRTNNQQPGRQGRTRGA